jgi:hypothetical protein
MYSLLQPVKFWWQQNKTKMINKVDIKSKRQRISDLAKGELQPSVFQAGIKPEQATSMNGAWFWSRLITFGKTTSPKSLFSI